MSADMDERAAAVARHRASETQRSAWNGVLILLVAVFATGTMLTAFSAPRTETPQPQNGVPGALLLLLLVLIVIVMAWGFGRSLRPPFPNAALVITLPWITGVALLCRRLSEEAMAHGVSGAGTVNTAIGTLRILPAQAWLVVLLCIVPFLLAFSLALLLTVRHDYRRDVGIRFPSGPGGAVVEPDEARWRDYLLSEWQFERERFQAIESSVAQQALMFGAVVSLTLIVCVLMITPWFMSGATQDAPVWATIATTVAAATTGTFLTSIGRIMVRVASHEAGSRMFAWGAKVHFVSVLTAALLGMLIGYDVVVEIQQPIAGALVGGILIGLLGTRATQAIVEGATTSLPGLKLKPLTAKATDLTKIDGIDQEHVDRFVEEGITTIHHLAHVPTPRLFFLTQYSIQTICDWQSQALLFDKLQDTTTTFRIAYGVRGAIDARRLIRAKAKSPGPHDPQAPHDKLRMEIELASDLLARDEEVERLELYTYAELSIPKEEPEREAVRRREAALSH